MPLARVAVVKVQAPEPLAVTVPRLATPLKRVTVLLASAVPFRTSTLSLLVPPLATVPVTGETSSVIEEIDGASGTVVSTVIAAAFWVGVGSSAGIAAAFWIGEVVVLPARSVWRTRMALRVWVPAASVKELPLPVVQEVPLSVL